MLIKSNGDLIIDASGSIPTYTPVVVSTPLRDGVHPRLLMVPNGYTHAPTISDVQAALATDITEFNAYVAYYNSQIAVTQTTGQAIMNYAFLYATYNAGISGVNYGGKSQSDYGTKALTELRALMALGGTVGYYYDAGSPNAQQVILGADWIWPLLDADDKADLAAYVQASVVGVLGDVNNSQVTASLSVHLLGRLLLAGEGLDDAWVDGALTGTLDGDWDTYVRGTTRGTSYGLSLWAGTSGAFSQGSLYGNTYTYRELLLLEEGYRTANGIDAATHYGTSATDILRYFPKHIAAGILSDAYPRSSNAGYNGGYKWLQWKGGGVQYPGVSSETTHGFRLTGGLTAHARVFASIDADMAGLSRWILENRGDYEEASGSHTGFYTSINVPFRWPLGTPPSAVTPASAGLALSQWHDHGWLTSRLSWDAVIDEPWIGFLAPRYFAGGYSPMHPGALSVHRKGPVLWQKGGINGHGPINTSWGSNALVFPDRTLDHTTINPSQDPSMGSVRYWSVYGGTFSNLANNWGNDAIGDMRGTTRTSLASGSRAVDYVLRDLTRMYSSNLTNGRDYYDSTGRVSSVIREVVYFKPATAGDPVRIFVNDTYTRINKRYRPECYWNPCAQPTLNGSTSAGPSRGTTGTDGKIQSTDTTLVTWDNGSTVSYLSILAPTSNYAVVRVGGANTGTGTRFIGSYGYGGGSYPGSSTDSHETEDPYGVQYAETPGVSVDPGSSLRPYIGEWRVETIDTTYAATDEAGTFSGQFLHALECADSGDSQSTTAALAGASSCVGGMIGDAVAVFATGGISQTSLAFRLETAGTYTVHISRLNPSAARTISKGANITSIVNVVGGGTTYTAGAAGDLLLTIVVGSNGTGAANTITVS